MNVFYFGIEMIAQIYPIFYYKSAAIIMISIHAEIRFPKEIPFLGAGFSTQ
jgi:predicted signal transduction protein with EAL and GGDEF domain